MGIIRFDSVTALLFAPSPGSMSDIEMFHQLT